MSNNTKPYRIDYANGASSLVVYLTDSEHKELNEAFLGYRRTRIPVRRMQDVSNTQYASVDTNWMSSINDL